MTFCWYLLTIQLTHCKVYIFVILITSRVIWYTWKVIWSILKFWPHLTSAWPLLGRGQIVPNFVKYFLTCNDFKTLITYFRQNDIWVLLILHLHFCYFSQCTFLVVKACFCVWGVCGWCVCGCVCVCVCVRGGGCGGVWVWGWVGVCVWGGVGVCLCVCVCKSTGS